MCCMLSFISRKTWLSFPCQRMLSVTLLQNLSRWAHSCSLCACHVACRRERSRAVTAVFGGLDVGSAVGLILCGPLIKHVGWPSVFYLFAGLGLLWTLLFPRLKPDEPDLLVPSELQPDTPGMYSLHSLSPVFSLHPCSAFRQPYCCESCSPCNAAAAPLRTRNCQVWLDRHHVLVTL